MTIRRLLEGDIVFHGTSSEARFEEEGDGTPEGPAWVSEGLGVAKWFESWMDGPVPRVIAYRVYREPQLFLWVTNEDLEEALEADDLNDWNPNELADEICALGYDGWIIPDNYPDGADILLCNPEEHLEVIKP